MNGSARKPVSTPPWAAEICAIVAAMIVAMSVASLNLRGHDVGRLDRQSQWAADYQGWPLTVFELTLRKPIALTSFALVRLAFNIVFGLFLIAATHAVARRQLLAPGWPQITLAWLMLWPVALAVTLFTFRNWRFDERPQYVHAAIALVAIGCLLAEVVRWLPRGKNVSSTPDTANHDSTT